MAVPKKRTSYSVKRMRRCNENLKAKTFILCNNCGDYKLPHHVCQTCGYYRGKKILSIKN